MIERLIIAGVGAVFGAGAAWAMLKELRRHVNGIGKKVNRLILLHLAFCPEDQRKAIAAFLDK